MRVFRAERSSLAVLLIALAASFVSRLAFAQSGAPIPLYPPNLSSPPDATPAERPPPLTAPANNDDIQTETLAPVDSSWTGTLGPADEALPRGMWSTTPRSLVATALPLL